MDPSNGATGAPQPSVPCQPSSHVSAPIVFAKLPSALKLNRSSYKHALVTTSASSADHQLISPWLGPTPSEPAVGESIQLPVRRLLSSEPESPEPVSSEPNSSDQIGSPFRS